MKKRLLSLRTAALLSLGFAATLAPLNAQPIADGDGDVVIGTNIVEPTAILDLVSTNKGFLVPRMSQVQRNLIPAPADALMIFNTTTSEFNYWDPSTGQWEVFITSANIEDYAWVLGGNNLDIAVDPLLQSAYDGTNGAFLGTNSADNAVIATTQGQAIDFFTNATRRFSIEAADGDIVPTNDNDIDLGSDANRFAEVYVNGSSVHIGPSGGEGAGTEMDLGYGANQGTINVDGGVAEVMINAGTGTIMIDADADGNANITSGPVGTTIDGDDNGSVDLMVESANGGRTVIGEGNDEEQLRVDGVPTAPNGPVAAWDATIDGDLDVQGVLGLTGYTDGSVTFIDNGGLLSEDNANFFWDDANNRLGLGTDNPLQELHIIGTDDPVEVRLEAYGIAASNFSGLRARGTVGAPAAVQFDDNLSFFSAGGYDGNGMNGPTGTLQFIATENWAPGSNGTAASIRTAANGTGFSVSRLFIDQDGEVGINQTNPSARLDVVGTAGVTAVEVNAAGGALGIEVNGGAVDGNFRANEFGDGTDQQQLTVNGDVGAIIGNTLAANPPEWDLVVGDQVTTGLIKAGGSIWIDGFTAGNHQIVGNDALNLGTISASDLTLSTNTANAVVVDGTTQNVNILQDADVDGNMNVDGATTLQSTLFVDGATTLDATLVVNGTTTLNAPLTVNASSTFDGTIDQINGGNVNFSGNVDAESGLDVSGQNLTVDPSVSIQALGSGHTMGTGGTDAAVLTIDGVNGGVTELQVNGDVGVTGGLTLGFLTPGSVVFAGPAGALSQDNPNFFFDNTNNRLGIGNNAPSQSLDVTGRVNSSESYDIDGNRFVWDGPTGTSTMLGNTGNTTNTGNSNTFVGRFAGRSNTIGQDNSFFGQSAGLNNLDGQQGTFVGVNAGLNNTSGLWNTFVGTSAGLTNSTGGFNVMVGVGAGFTNNANENTFVGVEAGRQNDAGFGNTFIGRSAGFDNVTGIQNVYLGRRAGVGLDGVFNVIVGSDAGNSLTTGNDNLILGQGAGQVITSGGALTLLGRNASAAVNGLSNAAAVGHRAQVAQSNSLVLGSISGVNGAGSSTNVGIGTTTPSARLNVVGDVTIETGDVVLPYATIASGGVVPANRVVVHVLSNGAPASQATVTLPAAGTNGQILIITTADPDGVVINGGSAVFATTNQHTAVRYIRAGGNWIAEN